jgi:hypothetical protein
MYIKDLSIKGTRGINVSTEIDIYKIKIMSFSICGMVEMLMIYW